MIGQKRMNNLRALLEDVLARGVPGSFVGMCCGCRCCFRDSWPALFVPSLRRAPNVPKHCQVKFGSLLLVTANGRFIWLHLGSVVHSR